MAFVCYCSNSRANLRTLGRVSGGAWQHGAQCGPGSAQGPSALSRGRSSHRGLTLGPQPAWGPQVPRKRASTEGLEAWQVPGRGASVTCPTAGAGPDGLPGRERLARGHGELRDFPQTPLLTASAVSPRDKPQQTIGSGDPGGDGLPANSVLGPRLVFVVWGQEWPCGDTDDAHTPRPTSHWPPPTCQGWPHPARRKDPGT